MTTPRKEHPYRMAPRLEKVKANLVENFGYGKLDAKALAVEICANLDRHVQLTELMIKRSVSRTTQVPTQTPYWKANNGNI